MAAEEPPAGGARGGRQSPFENGVAEDRHVNALEELFLILNLESKRHITDQVLPFNSQSYSNPGKQF
jgi:hypothetical protein